jgi:predicted enzyme related to lactoylglutathione lyase
MANVLDYVELAVDDLGQGTAFYAKALGWTFNDYGGEYAGIQDPRNPGQEVGGLNPSRSQTELMACWLSSGPRTPKPPWQAFT